MKQAVSGPGQDAPGRSGLLPAACGILEALWARTVERARRLPPELLHESVDGEWSFIETFRHLVFATGSWIRRAGREGPGWPPSRSYPVRECLLVILKRGVGALPLRRAGSGRASSAIAVSPCGHRRGNMYFDYAQDDASHGWQGAARGLGGMARENAVTPQCPESLTMCHVSEMYA